MQAKGEDMETMMPPYRVISLDASILDGLDSPTWAVVRGHMEAGDYFEVEIALRMLKGELAQGAHERIMAETWKHNALIHLKQVERLERLDPDDVYYTRATILARFHRRQLRDAIKQVDYYSTKAKSVVR